MSLATATSFVDECILTAGVGEGCADGRLIFVLCIVELPLTTIVDGDPFAGSRRTGVDVGPP